VARLVGAARGCDARTAARLVAGAETAARCELALLRIHRPTPEQVAGATMRALHAADVAALRSAYVEEE